MAERRVSPVAMVCAAVLLLGAVATVALIGNFSETGFDQTWPLLVVAVGASLVFFGYWELGLALMGFFGIWLLGNLQFLPPFSKSWPFTLIWIALLVVLGFLRARAGRSAT